MFNLLRYPPILAKTASAGALDHADFATSFAALGPWAWCTVLEDRGANDGLART
jgi:hypothetical protein